MRLFLRLAIGTLVTLIALPVLQPPATATQSPGATPVGGAPPSEPVAELALPAITEATCDTAGPAVTAPESTEAVAYGPVGSVTNDDGTQTFSYTATVTAEGTTLPDALPEGYARQSDTLATYTITLAEADCAPEMARSSTTATMAGRSGTACDITGGHCASVSVFAPETVEHSRTLEYQIDFARTSGNFPDVDIVFFVLHLPGENWTVTQDSNNCRITTDGNLSCSVWHLVPNADDQATVSVSRAVPEACGETITSDGAWSTNGNPALSIASFSTTVMCTAASPEPPTITSGHCAGGAFVPPAISFPDTDGITYDYTPRPLPRDGNVTVTATLAEAYSWGNTTGWTVTDNTATQNFSINSTDCVPDLAVTKAVTFVNGNPVFDAVTDLERDDIVTYRIIVENIGTAALADLTVTDPGVSDFACDATLPVTSFDPGGTVTCTGNHTVTEDDHIAGEIANTATANGTYDTLTVTESDAVTVSTVDAVTAITLEKSVDPPSVDAPGPVTYTFEIGNTGTLRLDDLSLTDDLVDLTALDCDGQDLPTRLNAGTSVTCTVPFEITQAMLDAGGPIVNEATASAIGSNRERVEATSSATLTLIQNPELTLTKTASTPEGTPVTAGTVITYTFTVTNSGNVTLENLVVADALPGIVWDASSPDGTVGTLGPGMTATVLATYTVTPGDAAGGVVTNQAEATGDGGGMSVSDTASAEVTTVGSVQPFLQLIIWIIIQILAQLG